MYICVYIYIFIYLVTHQVDPRYSSSRTLRGDVSLLFMVCGLGRGGGGIRVNPKNKTDGTYLSSVNFGTTLNVAAAMMPAAPMPPTAERNFSCVGPALKKSEHGKCHLP